ncbi:MAG: AMIN domain-containing protein [Firmicutes bacterium]|nr:AMIN domain-containing protein [Bacillota bacterium]
MLGMVLISMFSLQCLDAPTATAAPAKSISILINGMAVKNDTPPYIDNNNRTMVPIRFISEALGANVLWQEVGKKITVTSSDKEIELQVGKRSALIDGQAKTLDTYPVIKNNRTMVPLRFLGEALGTEITWRSNTRTVEMQIPVQPAQGQVLVEKDLVNLRCGPGTIFDCIGEAEKGDVFDLTGKATGWYQVDAAKNQKAWISASLVEIQSDSPSRGADIEDPHDTNPQPTPSVPTNTELLSISGVQTQGSTTTVKVKAVGSDYPKAFILSSPRRLVLDFSGILIAKSDQDRVYQASGSLVSKVRMGQFAPDTSRVVVDLKGPCSYTISSSSGVYSIKIEPPTLKGRTVVIDPGHGNYKTPQINDPGASGPLTGLTERELNMDISKQVSELLKAKGVNTILTRNGTTYISLEERAEIANRAKADVFVSIHSNSSENKELSGSTMYFSDPEDSKLQYQRGMRQALANSIQKQLLKELGRSDKGVREANYVVLRKTDVPSALVEVAFLSNPEEERLLNTPAFRKKAATAIANGVMNYLLGQQ